MKIKYKLILTMSQTQTQQLITAAKSGEVVIKTFTPSNPITLPILEPVQEPQPNSNRVLKLNKRVARLVAIVLVCFFVVAASQILNFPYQCRNYLLGPYLQELHVWILFVRHIYKFLEKAAPGNMVTGFIKKWIKSCIVYATTDRARQEFVMQTPQTVALRPHILRAYTEYLKQQITSENKVLIESQIKVLKLMDLLFEIGRILGIDTATLVKICNGKEDYNDTMHFINEYRVRLTQVTEFFIRLFDRVAQNPASIEQIFLGALDFPASEATQELYKTVITLVEEVEARLQTPIIIIRGGKSKKNPNKKQKAKSKTKKSKTKKYQRKSDNMNKLFNKLSKLLLI